VVALAIPFEAVTTPEARAALMGAALRYLDR
jgi:hypothetical protein